MNYLSSIDLGYDTVEAVVANVLEKQSHYIFVNIHINHSLTVLLVGKIHWITISETSPSSSTAQVYTKISEIKYSIMDPNPNIAWDTQVKNGVKKWIIASIRQIRNVFLKKGFTFIWKRTFTVIGKCFKYKLGRLDAIPACFLLAIAVKLEKPIEVIGINDIETFRKNLLNYIPTFDDSDGTLQDSIEDANDNEDDDSNNGSDDGVKSSLIQNSTLIDLDGIINGLTLQLAPVINDYETPTVVVAPKSVTVTNDEYTSVRDTFSTIIVFNDSDDTDYEMSLHHSDNECLE
jgi:hypothetical protein